MKAMKHTVSVMLVMSMACANAALLSKTAQRVKKGLDDAGASSCSQAAAETVDFLADGRSIVWNSAWSTSEPAKKSIHIDITVAGDNKNFSRVGAIVFTPTGNQCQGSYVYNTPIGSKDCKRTMEENGFVEPQWKQVSSKENGDGGSSYFVELTGKNNLNFTFNDLPGGGCVMTKRESLSSPKN